jgi:hypothetical protein
MIIVKLQGGLGNQLFQYAMGRHLSIKNNDVLIVDNSFLNITNASGYTLRSYELDIFPITPAIQNQEKYFGKTILSRIRSKLSRIKYVGERSFKFMPEVLDLTGDTYLEGFWQTEKYFCDIADIIRDDLIFLPDLNDVNTQVARQINTCNAVSLHVRRTDYVSKDAAATYHNLCSLSYYFNAIEEVVKAVPDAVFFLFSDDMPWVRENLQLDYPHYFIDHNKGKDSYADMQLMSMCKHHIIANSSFSWWSAWLNKYEHKIVVAPEKWFYNPEIDTSDIIPESWLKL